MPPPNDLGNSKDESLLYTVELELVIRNVERPVRKLRIQKTKAWYGPRADRLRTTIAAPLPRPTDRAACPAGAPADPITIDISEIANSPKIILEIIDIREYTKKVDTLYRVLVFLDHLPLVANYSILLHRSFCFAC